MLTNNIALCWPNYLENADLTVLSGGEWDDDEPLSNLVRTPLSNKAKSVGLDDVHFAATLPTARRLQAFALAGHNLSLTATWKVTRYSGNGLTGYIDDTGWVPAWLTDDADVAARHAPLAAVFVDSDALVKSVLIEIEDDGNVDGFVTIGYALAAPAIQPTFNMNNGAELGRRIATEVEAAIDGVSEYFDVKVPRAELTFGLSGLQQDEAAAQLDDLALTMGLHKPLLVAWDQDSDHPAYINRTFLGRLSQVNPITAALFNDSRGTVNILQVR